MTKSENWEQNSSSKKKSAFSNAWNASFIKYYLPNRTAFTNKWNFAKNLQHYQGENIPITFRVYQGKIVGNSKYKNKIVKNGNVWFLKKASVGQGYGIRIGWDPINLIRTTAKYKPRLYVMQEAVQNLFLHENKKFDIRMLVLFVCPGDYEPWQAYVYNDGIMRLCVKDFEPNKLKLAEHLTNHTQQKRNTSYDKEKHVKALSEIPEYDQIFDNIKKSLRKMSATFSSKLKSSKSPAYWIGGFDFIVDTDLWPWLLEINGNPGMLASNSKVKIYHNAMKSFAKHFLTKMAKKKIPSAPKNIKGWDYLYTRKEIPKKKEP